MMKFLHPVFFTAVVLLLAGCGQDKPATSAPQAASDQKVVVYSARAEHLIKPLFDSYTAKTGVKVEYITDNAGSLLARLGSEGASTPADLLLTVDVGNLWHASQQGVLQPVQSDVLNANIPAHLRDPENRWFGLTRRARTIVYASDRVKPEQLKNYADLADVEWQGRLCLRTSKKVYNQSLVASFIAHLGEEATAAILRGWVANLAVAPFANDTAAMEAVLAGQCDVTIVNTYYFGELEAAGKAGSLKIFWPNQANTGVHINISGAGITKHSKRPEAALALLEWLSSEEAQGMLAGLNLEFPVHPAVESVQQVKDWGEFLADTLPLSKVAEQQVPAVRLIDQVGYQ
ncbi:MAG TPA: Fe(3+) ABC transporter substrate-binding protein [Pseudomonadales bacterium]